MLKSEFKKYVKELEFGDQEAIVKRALFSKDLPYEYLGDLIVFDDSVDLTEGSLVDDCMCIDEHQYTDVKYTGVTQATVDRVAVVTCCLDDLDLCRQALGVFLMLNFEKVNYTMIVLACTATGEFSFFRRELINRIVLQHSEFEE